MLDTEELRDNELIGQMNYGSRLIGDTLCSSVKYKLPNNNNNNNIFNNMNDETCTSLSDYAKCYLRSKGKNESLGSFANFNSFKISTSFTSNKLNKEDCSNVQNSTINSRELTNNSNNGNIHADNDDQTHYELEKKSSELTKNDFDTNKRIINECENDNESSQLNYLCNEITKINIDSSENTNMLFSDVSSDDCVDNFVTTLDDNIDIATELKKVYNEECMLDVSDIINNPLYPLENLSPFTTVFCRKWKPLFVPTVERKNDFQNISVIPFQFDTPSPDDMVISKSCV